MMAVQAPYVFGSNQCRSCRYYRVKQIGSVRVERWCAKLAGSRDIPVGVELWPDPAACPDWAAEVE